MYWGISPSLVKESALLVKIFEIVHVSLRPQKFQRCHLEIRPKVTQIVRFTVIVTDKVHKVVFGDILWV